MSKIFMSTDWHFGVHPLSLNKWLNIQLNYFHKQMIPYLIENKKEGDVFIMLGDLFDNRTSVPILVQNKVEDLLIEIGKILPIHVIVGNHDLWNKGDNSINSPRIFRHLKNVHIYENTSELIINNKKLILMPWVEKRDDMIDELKNNPGDFLFCHSDLNGCRMHLSSVAHRNKNKIDVESFSGYKRVYSGHIHIRQIHKNFEFIGAPYQMDRNDYNDIKGLTILDLETEENDFIPNVVSPTFKKVKIEQDDDLLLLENLNTNDHFVDLEINNSVLIGKRKNRKILEGVLGKKKFASVDYINDLIKVSVEDEDSNHKKIKIKFDDIENDFGSTILEYTEKQEYNNEKDKIGVVSEVKKILSLYEKEKKEKKDKKT